jgi:SAM-dependent methyltransferase
MLSKNTPQEYLEEISISSIAAPSYTALLHLLPNQTSTVLDVGVGLGQSSVLLASKGIRCFSVEPSDLCCSILHQTATKFDLPIEVCRGVAEDIHNIGKSDFDAVFFNASLHHCDDPALALANAYNCLRPGGTIFLVNENLLRPWTSKARFQQLLESDPVGMGHYGGNEHSYYSWEYMGMLRSAGFSEIRKVPPFALSALDKIEHILSKKIANERVYNRTTQIFTRLAYYSLEEKIRKSGLLFQMLSGASIVACHFTAVKS